MLLPRPLIVSFVGLGRPESLAELAELAGRKLISAREVDTSVFKGVLVSGTKPLWQYALSVSASELRLGTSYFLVLIPDGATFALIMGCASHFSAPVDDMHTVPVPRLHSCTSRNGIRFADEAQIAVIEDALGVAPHERWATVTTRGIT